MQSFILPPGARLVTRAQNPSPVSRPRRHRFPRHPPPRACTPPAPASLHDVESAIAAVSSIYGDDGDGASEHFRWNQAHEDIASSGLLSQTIAHELTYGEFDLALLSRGLSIALAHLPPAPAPCAFVDIGSGYGRAAHGAAALLGDAWRVSGLEIVPAMHAYAADVEAPWSGRVRFVLGDYAEEGGAAEDALRAADVCFAFATTWPSAGTPYLAGLSRVLGDRLRDGAVAMTADKQLVQEELGPGGDRFQEVGRVDGPNRCCGDSTVFVYRFCKGGR